MYRLLIPKEMKIFLSNFNASEDIFTIFSAILLYFISNKINSQEVMFGRISGLSNVVKYLSTANIMISTVNN